MQPKKSETEKSGRAKPETIRLPEPSTVGGKSLLAAVKERHSTREYSAVPLAPQELSDILWVAAGLTREYAGRGIHTPGSHAAPAAHNWQEVSVYVALQHGLYLYDAANKELAGISSDDVRYLTAHEEQPFVLDVPVILIYVADFERMEDASEWDKGIFPWADSAAMAENVYLYCASAGLATVCRAKFERPPLAQAMGIGPNQLVTFSQPVGYPA